MTRRFRAELVLMAVDAGDERTYGFARHVRDPLAFPRRARKVRPLSAATSSDAWCEWAEAIAT